jgi:hypothetical protein
VGWYDQKTQFAVRFEITNGIIATGNYISELMERVNSYCEFINLWKTFCVLNGSIRKKDTSWQKGNA